MIQFANLIRQKKLPLKKELLGHSADKRIRTENEKLIEGTIKDYAKKLRKEIHLKEIQRAQNLFQKHNSQENVRAFVNTENDKENKNPSTNPAHSKISGYKKRGSCCQISSFSKRRSSLFKETLRTLEKEKPMQLSWVMNVNLVPFIRHISHHEEFLQELSYIFKKKKRTTHEILYLQHFLTIFNVIKLFSKNLVGLNKNELIYHMAKCISIHEYKKNELLYRIGEYSDKFYYIVDGSVDVILVREVVNEVNFFQFLNQLYKLKNIKEYEIVKLTIEANEMYKDNPIIQKLKNEIEKLIKKATLYALKKSKNADYYNYEFDNLNEKTNILIDNTIKPEIEEEEIVSTENYLKRANYNEEEINEYNTGEIPRHTIKEIKDMIRYKKIKENIFRQKKTLTFYEFYVNKKLENYTTFGEESVEEKFKLRTGSIISTKESKICYLDINSYTKSIKYFREYLITQSILCLKTLPFFIDINYDLFKMRYYNYFSSKDYKIGDILFKQNDTVKKIFFVKKGEIELIMQSSINHINYLIERKFDSNDYLTRNIFSKTKEQKDEYLINVSTNDKNITNWRVLGIFPMNAVGLNEILLDSTYYVTARCVSYSAEIYEVDYNIFYNTIIIDSSVKDLFEKYARHRSDYILERLKNMRKILINNKYKCNEYKIINLSNYDDKKNNYMTMILKNHKINKDFIKYCHKRKFLNKENSKTQFKDNNDNTNYHFQSIFTSSRKSAKINKKIKLCPSTDRKEKKNNNELKSNNYQSPTLPTDYEKPKNNIFLKTANNFRTITIENKKNNNNISTKKNINNFIGQKEKKTRNNTDLYFNNDKLRNHINFNSNLSNNFVDKTTSTSPMKPEQKLEYKNSVKYTDFVDLVKSNQSSFQYYINKVKKIKYCQFKKPKIMPFSSLMFSLSDIESKYSKNDSIATTSLTLSNDMYISKKARINNYECLVLDKLIDEKYNSNDNRSNNNIILGRYNIKKKKKDGKLPYFLEKRLALKKYTDYSSEKIIPSIN